MEQSTEKKYQRAKKGELGETRMVSFKMPVTHIEKVDRLKHKYGNKSAVVRAAIDQIDE